MTLDYIKRAPKNTIFDHSFADPKFLGTMDKPPCTVYEKRPLINPKTGEKVEGLYTGWIILNNAKQGNSYTLEMVKGAAAGFNIAAHDKSVVAIIFTGAGDRFFCTGGNVVEYSEYYSGRPFDTSQYMMLYWHAMESLWTAQKPVIRRANGVSLAGGEEISGPCDLTIASDLATFGQIGPLHGSAAMGGALQFKPVCWTYEDAVWNTTSCEQWSAYKMFRKNYLHKVVPVLKKDGKWIRNPEVITDKWIDETGEIVYGEFKTDKEKEKAEKLIEECQTDMSQLDQAVNEVVWTYVNLYPGCLAMSFAILRRWKRANFDFDRVPLMYWWSAMPYGEYDMGMSSFRWRKAAGSDVIDMVKYRRMIAEGHPVDEELFETVMPKPKKK
jgi:6-oxo-cyclohex-1-ene-carbonyl-CoA hydrolase